jgi:8-oxo-dGTP pyrophosphatase MutT (NUDIX family)
VEDDLMSAYRDREGIVVLLVDTLGRIAMQLRDNKPGLPAANQWGLFGGLMDTGEAPLEAAQREIHEELGITLDPQRLVLMRKHHIAEQNLTTWVFHYPVDSELDHAVLREGQGWDFLSRDDPRASNIGLHHYEIAHQFWQGLSGQSNSV